MACTDACCSADDVSLHPLDPRVLGKQMCSCGNMPSDVGPVIKSKGTYLAQLAVRSGCEAHQHVKFL
jgi:hypothetical protein